MKQNLSILFFLTLATALPGCEWCDCIHSKKITDEKNSHSDTEKSKDKPKSEEKKETSDKAKDKPTEHKTDKPKETDPKSPDKKPKPTEDKKEKPKPTTTNPMAAAMAKAG